jgi:hypothetical protein
MTLRSLRFTLLAAVVLSMAAFGQTAQVAMIANLANGDSSISMTNVSTSNICVNVYVFDPAEEQVSCCSCPITPNGLAALSARRDLISNTLTPGVPTSISVILQAVAGAPTVCDATKVAAGVPGLVASSTNLHATPVAGTYAVTETKLSDTLLPVDPITIVPTCKFMKANGSGYGICKSCQAGALGAGKAN